MDASMSGGVSSEVVASVVGECTEAGKSQGKQGAFGGIDEESSGVPKKLGLGEAEKVEGKSADGSSNVLTNVSKDGITEQSRLAVPAMLGSNIVSEIQLADTVDNVPNMGGTGPIKEKSVEENGAPKAEEERDSSSYLPKDLANEIPQGSTELQLPMRQLARKGGMLKAEAAAGPKTGGNAPSIADTVKEGILQKEKEQDKKEALAAVMAVHGRKKEAAGHAASFPGVIGPESGRLCHSCSKPESSRATIFCDKCERSFHVDCVKLLPKAARETDVWHCGPCGLQPGHYWPLGRVLISYKDAVAEYQKYSSKSKPTDKRLDAHAKESSFGTSLLGMDKKGEEKPDGVQDSAQVKEIRDFKKEARKGAKFGYGAKYQGLKGSVTGTPTQPVFLKAEALPAVQMHLHDTRNTTPMRPEYSASGQAQGGTPQQGKKYLYPGYVPIQQRPLLNTTVPVINFNVSPPATVVRALTSPTAPLGASHQPKPILPYPKYSLIPDAPSSNHPGSMSAHATSTTHMHMTGDSIFPKPLNSRQGPVPGCSQSQDAPVVTQYVGTPDPPVVSSSDLPSACNQTQPKAEPASGGIGLRVSSIERLRPLVPGEPLTEREELLKDAKESLQQLQTFITAIRGDLKEGWEVVLRRRPTGALDKFFLSPAKRKYRSRLDVARYLGLVDDPRCQKTKSGDSGPSLEKVLINQHSEKIVQETNLPMFCGDVMIEKLGILDSRPTYCNENQIWPVGFRSSWHDSETGSYCISEVRDGGDSGPVFRVTRKLVIGPANNNNVPLATTSPGKTAHISENSPVEPESAKSGIFGEKVSEQGMDRPGGLEVVGKMGVIPSLAERSSLHADKLDTKDNSEEPNRHHAELEGQNKPSSDRKELTEALESGGKNLKVGEAVVSPVKNQIATNYSVGLTVIDLSDSGEEKEVSEEVRHRDIMDERYAFLDVRTNSKTMDNGKGEFAPEKKKAHIHSSKLPPTVIDLSDAEDEKPLDPPISRDILDAKYAFLDVSTADKNGGYSSVKSPALLEKHGGHNKEVMTDAAQGNALGVLPSNIRPLPNILMEELTVEARTPAEAWKLFGKQFVEHCRKSLESGQNCAVPILEATNDYVIFNSTTPDTPEGAGMHAESASSALLSQKSINRRETTKALLFARLEKRLGEDRFGLNLPAVQNMIKALHFGRTAGHDITFVKEVEQTFKPVAVAAVPAPPAKEMAVTSPPCPWRIRKGKKKSPPVLDISSMKYHPTNAGDEAWKKVKLPPAELVASHQASVAVGEQHEVDKVVFYNDYVPPVVIPPVPVPVPVPAPAPLVVPAPPPFIFVEEPRLPPPAGQPILKRLPPELVGDLLQVWEFLCRFSDLLGQESQLTLEDLEAGLVDMGPVGPEHKILCEAKEGKNQSGDKEEIVKVSDSSEQGPTAGLEEIQKCRDPDESGEKDLMKDNTLSNELTAAEDSRQENVEVDKLEQVKSSNQMEGTQTEAAKSISRATEGDDKEQKASEDVSCEGTGSKETQASEQVPDGVDSAVAFPDGTVSQGLVFLAGAHIPLLKFLVSDLKFRVAGSQNEGETDEPKKRGRRRICDIGPPPPEFGDDLPMNALTWPELAHRYLVALLDVRKQGEVAELVPEERKKLVRFFEGDGGVMGGAVEGVVGVESDAQVLAEAEKELSIRMPKPVEKDIVVFVPQEWDVALTPINPAPKKTKAGKTGERPEVLPKWVEALEPVRKMPTNLGTKIKNQVQESLDSKPPEWAKATLDWSLSKGTFKSNAAGTTKRAVLEVLAQYHGEELKAINAPRVRKVKPAPSAEHLMQRCRIVLREVAKADSKQVFCNLVGGVYAVKASKVAVTVARPLDFRTIDARLAAGAYGGSTEAFAADMRQIWKNVEGVHKSGSVMVELADTLSQIFEKLYLKQVISLIKGVSETKEREKEKGAGPDVDIKVDGSGRKSSTNVGTETSGKDVDGKLGKAPWEDDMTCRVCGIDEDYDSILLCDGCDAEYHIYCLVPPLEKVPEGNWFCPSCVAVEEGFPEAPSLGVAEVAAFQGDMEKPVAGSILRLEFEDEKVPSVNEEDKKADLEKGGRKLRSRSKPGLDVDDEAFPKGLDSQPPAVESSVQALLSRMEEKEYWQLTLADRLFLLKFLCDEALKTPQVRAHLEKSVDVALELQQQLRDLVAERLKMIVPMDVTNHMKSADHENKQKLQVSSVQTGQSTEGKETTGGAEAVVQAAGLIPPTSEVSEAPKATPTSLPAPKSDAGALISGNDMPGIAKEESLEGVGKVVHDLDLNVVAVREPDSDTTLVHHKLANETPGLANTVLSAGTSAQPPSTAALQSEDVPMEDSKKRNLVDTGALDRSALETEQRSVQQNNGGSNKRFKAGTHPGEDTAKLDSYRREETNGAQPTIGTADSRMVGNETGSGVSSVEERPGAQPRESGTRVVDVPPSDRTSLPVNSLKRSLETESSGLPNTSGDGLESGKKARREEESLVKSTLSGVGDTKTTEDTKIFPDGAGADAKALEEEKGRMRVLQSARDLDDKITRLGSKLFNASLRREHMGTDHLWREYWALTGVDQRPWLVLAEMTSARKDKANEGLSCDLGGQSIGLRGIGDSNAFPSGKDGQETGASNERKQSDVSDMKSVDEGIRWLSYQGDKALDELVKWLSPRCQQERALRVAIYHWRRSVYPRHLLDMPEALIPHSRPQLDAPIVNEPSKDGDESGESKETSSSKNKMDTRRAQTFPIMKATNILQKRYAAPGAAGSDEGPTSTGLKNQKKTWAQKDGELRRCECLEPSWTSRLHCQTCHETYESTAEFQLHLSDCPPGSKPIPEAREKETQPPISASKAKKATLDGSKSAVKIKRLTSLDKEQDLNQRLVKGGGATRSERAKRGLKRGLSEPTAGDADVNMETEEAPELLSNYVESLKAKKTPPPLEAQQPIEDTPSNGLLRELEELMEPSSEQAYYPQPPEQAIQESMQEPREENRSFDADDWSTNPWPEKFDVRRGKQDSTVDQSYHSLQDLNANQLSGHCSDIPQGDQGNRGGWLNDLNNSNQVFREDASSSFEYNSPAPMMFSTPESTRDRISQIGFSDHGPTFTPGLHNSPAFDPSLLIPSSPYYPCLDGFPSLDQSNPAGLQYQQFMPPHDTLNQTSAPHTNFMLALSDATSRPVPYNQYLSSLDNSSSALNYQQFLPPHDSLNTAPSPYTNFLPTMENLNSAPTPFTSLLLDSTNSQPPLYSQYLPSLENNLNPNSNPSASSYVDLNTSSNQSALAYSNLNINAKPSTSHFANLNTNSNPLLCTTLNSNSNPSVSPYAHYPPNNPFAEPEPKRFDQGRFYSNSWFDAPNTVDPMTVERPAVIPTKPTARRTSTWDYLTSLPLPTSQGSERFVQKHHVEAPRGHPVAPAPPIEVGSLPFDLMFEKPQREDLNLSTVSDDVGILTLDLMFEKQQIEGPGEYPVPEATPMKAGSLTLDLMFEKQEQEQTQECKLPHDCAVAKAAPGEVGAVSIDLMLVPEEQMECVHVDDIEAAGEACIDGVRDTQVDSKEEEQVEVNTEPISEEQTVAPPPPPAAAAADAVIVVGKKPVKRFPVVDASVRPLVGGQKYLLKGLQISLLDMEAAMTNDVLESARASPLRRRAWRSLVKSATCIYEMTKAAILLEHMVKAEYLKPNWGYWSSLSAAARSTSLSALALRLFALDTAITYERVNAPGEGKEAANSNKTVKNKKKKPLEIPPKKKKK